MKTHKTQHQYKQTEFEFTKKLKRKKTHNKEKRRLIETIKDKETQLEFDYIYEL